MEKKDDLYDMLRDEGDSCPNCGCCLVNNENGCAVCPNCNYPYNQN